MLGVRDDPGECIVCGAAHCACTDEKDDGKGVGVTRGVILVKPAPRLVREPLTAPTVTMTVKPIVRPVPTVPAPTPPDPPKGPTRQRKR